MLEAYAREAWFATAQCEPAGEVRLAAKFPVYQEIAVD
jgi:hypothetical protein